MCCYAQPWPSDGEPARREKQRLSSAARQTMNFRHAWQKLELLLAANFAPHDWFVTLTYNDEHLPADRKAAGREMAKLWRALRAQRAAAGKELRYIYNIEEMPDEPGASGRLHHHAVINAAGDPRDTIQALWGRGDVRVDRLLDGPRSSYEARARYLVKERHPGALGRRPGLRAWTPSRNLLKPEVTSELVPDTQTIAVPPGAYILDRSGLENFFGSFQFLKFLIS